MTDLIDNVQQQEVDDAIVQLFDITLPGDSGTKVYFFNGLDDGTNNIYFPNKQGTALIEYLAIPIEIEGIEAKSDGVQGRPTLQIANIPTLVSTYLNNNDGVNDETTFLDILTENALLHNEDFLNSIVEYRTTLLSKTYKVSDVPTPPAVWSTLPVEFPSTTFIVDRISSENPLIVDFELASPIDLEGVKLPGRVVVGKYCPWRYQGYSLLDEGGCTWPLDSKGCFYDIDDNIIAKKDSSVTPAVYKVYYNNTITSDTIPEYSSTNIYSSLGSSSNPTRVYTSETFISFLQVDITNPGSGYNPAALPTVTFSAPPAGGTQATGYALIVGDKVQAIIVTNYGKKYTSPPTITIGAGSGTQATAVAKSLEHIQIWRLLRAAPAGKTPIDNPFYWYREDVCGKLITSCKKRFQGNVSDNVLNTAVPLPFGGFPGSKNFK